MLQCIACAVCSMILLVSCGSDDASVAADAGDSADAAAPESCEGPDFEFAPPPSDAFGIHRVAIDVVRVEGEAVFDVTAQSALGRATMWFRMGDEGGNPTFDLRQVITRAELNGVEIADADFQLRQRRFDNGRMRAAEMRLEPCTDNTLYVEYELGDPLPEVNNGQPPLWDSGAVEWGFKLYDVWEGRLLEQWIPSGLLHDRFELTYEVELQNTSEAHTLMSNGEVEALGQHHWKVVYPDHFTSQSPFLEIVPSARLASETRVVSLPGDQQVTLELYQHADVPEAVTDAADIVEQALIEFATSDGPYLHGDRFLAYVLDDAYEAEEYEGATTTHYGTTIMRHEVYHSWFGRGVVPATFNDSWFDEAWVEYVTAPPEPLAADEEPIALATDDPWLRSLPQRAYTDGAAMFVSLASEIGADELAALMASFVRENQLRRVTTADLERHLYCGSDEPRVLFWFHRFVYGRDGSPPVADPGYCDS